MRFRPVTPAQPALKLWLAILVALLLVWALFHQQINDLLTIRLILASSSPREEVVSDLLRRSKHPATLLGRFWNSGKIVQRELVVRYLNEQALANPPWFRSILPLLGEATRDPDMSVRELALAALDSNRSPQLFECARAQLTDVDPMIRLLGLGYLKKMEARGALPSVVGLLEDADLRVVAEAELALAHWSGQDYGVRVRLAMPEATGPEAGRISAENSATIRRGVERRKEWWRAHAAEYGSVPPLGTLNRGASVGTPAATFTLRDLDGHRTRLSDFRGRVVLANFWASWCTACLAEIPELIRVQNEPGRHAVIIGIALDGVSDDHSRGEDNPGTPEESRTTARARLLRAVQSRAINYPVLWDETGAVGNQYNGGELPTTVIIDAQGRLRRRFVGERSAAVFEAMIAEAARPAEAH